MTLMTIIEAARFLRLTKRTLYQRADIPRVRYGHRIMFVKEDLEKWVRTLTEGPVTEGVNESIASPRVVDGIPRKVCHKNPLFLLPRAK
ncbi:MAG TPA: helix-turn-helix domain-containing protein [Nitrospira sp.]|nr:helix-turn-helix domain-containing protein [Nitrospira sp.]